MNAILTSPPQGISIENALNILRSLNFNILNVEELQKKISPTKKQKKLGLRLKN